MSDKTTKRMLAVYEQERPPTLYLSGKFASPPQNFHTSEEVEIDIQRSEEEVAIVIEDLSTGYRMNADDIYTNKSFKPPIFKEAATLNAFDLIKRMPGADPFADANFQANATLRAFKSFRKIENKIRRAMELQASQVLLTGTVTLTDNAGASLYTIDYKPKSTHFPTAAIPWNDVGNTKTANLQALANVIRADGLTGSDVDVTFGAGSWDLFITDTTVLALLDNRKLQLGGIGPERKGNGATFMGTLWIGDFRMFLWTYAGRYKHPVSGVSTAFIPDNKVIMEDPNGRKDATFGAIPRIVPPDARVMPYLPARMSTSAGGMDLFTNAWVSADGENLFVGAGARPLLIPTAIDTYGCLDTDL